MHVEVKSKNLTGERQSKSNGKTYGNQQAALHNGADYPMPFVLNVEKGREYEPGVYDIDPRSFSTNKFGELQLGYLRLNRRQVAAAKAA